VTPVELRDGIWYKREDLYTLGAVNGSKLRAAQHILERKSEEGYRKVVVGASVGAPTPAIIATIAADIGLECQVIVGGTTPEKAVKHRPIRIAADAGATITSIGIGYGTALKRAAKEAADFQGDGVFAMYGTTTDEDVDAFLAVGGAETANLPDEVETLIVPFGSANTACGVLYGLHDHCPANLTRVILMEIGPSRREWAEARLESVGRTLTPDYVAPEFVTLHEVWASYGDKMPEALDGITFHPTYEGKIIRWLNLTRPDYWTSRDGTTCFWIVGGPL
jgi:1-aminocyclopropane-1-carboxylate deaminase/D-cysteine desulfhydrase-like pyridoxal-dependent ACC family enzyme